MQHGYVISDLHIFTQWSSIEKYMQKIRNAAAGADFFVFNGDIFDFRWSTLGSSEATAKAAIQWFRTLCSECPDCRFIYILGNHDAYEAIVKPLAEFADHTGNFTWHDSYFRTGSSLFMHGDLIFSMRHCSPFHRKKFRKREPRSAIIRSGYNLAIEMGAHNLISRIHAKKRCAKYILKILEPEHREKLEGVTDIYIGHTHVGFSDFKYRGYTFHNSGSAIHDLYCNMMKIKP